MTIDSPPVKVITPPLLHGLLNIARRLEQASDIKAVLFQGANPGFCIAHFDLDSEEGRLKPIQGGLQNLCGGLISLRKQSGAITGMVTAAVMLNERANSQLQNALRKT